MRGRGFGSCSIQRGGVEIHSERAARVERLLVPVPVHRSLLVLLPSHPRREDKTRQDDSDDKRTPGPRLCLPHHLPSVSTYPAAPPALLNPRSHRIALQPAPRPRPRSSIERAGGGERERLLLQQHTRHTSTSTSTPTSGTSRPSILHRHLLCSLLLLPCLTPPHRAPRTRTRTPSSSRPLLALPRRQQHPHLRNGFQSTSTYSRAPPAMETQRPCPTLSTPRMLTNTAVPPGIQAGGCRRRRRGQELSHNPTHPESLRR